MSPQSYEINKGRRELRVTEWTASHGCNMKTANQKMEGWEISSAFKDYVACKVLKKPQLKIKIIKSQNN